MMIFHLHLLPAPVVVVGIAAGEVVVWVVVAGVVVTGGEVAGAEVNAAVVAGAIVTASVDVVIVVVVVIVGLTVVIILLVDGDLVVRGSDPPEQASVLGRVIPTMIIAKMTLLVALFITRKL